MQEILPVHPRTGLRAVGIVGGRPVWPIFGAEDNPPANQPVPVAPPATGTPTPDTPPTPPSTPPAGATPPKADEPLGEGGLKALQAEREARKALEKKLEGLAPLEKLAAALGADPAAGKSEIEQITERLANHEQQLLEANTARWRAEIANASGLTVEQAAELRGSTRDELAAHAERLKVLFPSVPPPPGTPRPDLSQGGQGGSGVNLDTQILEAQKAGKWRDVITLQNQKLTSQ